MKTVYYICTLKMIVIYYLYIALKAPVARRGEFERLTPTGDSKDGFTTVTLSSGNYPNLNMQMSVRCLFVSFIFTLKPLNRL